MKIFLVCNSLGGGGAERVHVNLANGFAQRGHEVYLVADIYRKVAYPVDEKVNVLPLCPDKNNKLLKWTTAIRRLRTYIKRYRADVVIGNMQLCSIISRLATIGLGVPVVLTIHHAMESKAYKFSKLEMFLDGYTPSFYAATTVLTNEDKVLLAQKYNRKKNVFVMPNPLTFTPVTMSDGQFYDEKNHILRKEKIILAAGRLDNWRCKGWDVLIYAAKELKPLLIREGWVIKIAGEGTPNICNFLDSLRTEADVTECLEFIGYNTNMKELFQKASVFCLSSRSEGLPMVLIEAMSQGCAPVACENLGRTKEIITKESEGLLFKTADVDDLAKQLSLVITNNEKRKEIQLSTIKRSIFYSIENIIDMWELLLKKIVTFAN